MPLSHTMMILNQTAQLLTFDQVDSGDYAREVTICIQNLDANNFVLIGDDTVTTASYGFRISPGQTFTATLNADDEIYAVTDNGTTEIALIRILQNG
jgi:hypothetical protein